MNLRHLLCALALACLLTACGSGPVRKVHPSTASIQQLAVQPDGSWKITLRIQNFSTFPMRYGTVRAMLAIAGSDAGEIVSEPGFEILGSSGDVVETVLKSSAKLPANGDFAYTLKGTIDTIEPKESFKLDTSSRLSPVPGVANTYR